MTERDAMTFLTILPMGKRVKIQRGTNLLKAIQQAGIEIASPCNG